MNVFNIEADYGATEKALFGVFYGDGPDWDNAGWRETEPPPVWRRLQSKYGWSP
jgi:hypothetical protein